MARWREKLRTAKFKKIEFHVDSISFETGRRGPLHEFPGRDIPYREDLGRKARSFPIEGYLVGQDYLEDKKKMIEACESKGPGILTHPYYGDINVVCESLHVQETAGEGGFCKLSFKFVEAGLDQYPSETVDTRYKILQATDSLKQGAIASFVEDFNTVGSAQSVLNDANSKFEDFANQLGDVSDGLSGKASDIADLAFSIRDLKAQARDLMGTPASLAEKMNSSFAFLANALNPSDLFNAAKAMFGFGVSDPAVDRTTTSRALQAKNRGAINDLVQILALLHASLVVPDISYASAEEAIEARDILTDQIDKLSLSVTNDEVYNSLQNLRSAVFQALPAPNQNLARILDYTPPFTMPSLALVFERYGSLDLEEDFLSRNHIINPSFIQGGIPLKVLDRG